MTKTVLKKEIRFAWHMSAGYDKPDLHYVREDITYNDGSIEPHTYLVEDLKRPVYVTKTAYRNHKDKKEFEHKDKLNMQMTTESNLNRTVAGMLNAPHLSSNRSAIKNSPYVYGYDITSTSLIKYGSLKRNDYIQSPYSVAGFDIETNPTTDEILLATIAKNDAIHTSILKKFVANIPDVEYRLKKAIAYYLPEYAETKFEFKVVDTEVDLIRDNFSVANKWKPDFLTIWNMDFDIPKVLNALKRADVSPLDVLCDPDVPRKYRMCKYKQGAAKKVMASGRALPINPALRWHTLMLTAPFYVIDGMCVYRQIRMGSQEEPSYSLNAILTKELNKRKLSFKEADGYTGVKWHLFMQENYPIEYIIYNIYDSLSMLELDAKTKDISCSLPAFAVITDFQKFNSQGRKVTNNSFMFGLSKGRIIGTVPDINRNEDEAEIGDGEDGSGDGDEDEDEDDPSKYKTLDLKGWIQLLPQNLLVHNGLKCLEDYPGVITNIRGITCDIDMVSSYPSCTQVANVSKATCINEVISIKNVPEEVFKEMNLSVCLGNANMLEYGAVMFGLPTLDEIDKYL